ncbi:MAG TPA: hypothetical protein ENH99_03260 [Candidatus Pacearchaeota archaeon]|nr:hypothetical protein [Candidatus Pacearchaeota archaeon]
MGDDEEKDLDYDDIDSDEAEYSSKSDFSKAKIVYEAMQKCIAARGKEMKAGYYNIKLSNDGSPLKMWVEDSRQVFIGTVESLRGLLSPEIKNEEEYKKSITTYYEAKKTIKAQYVYKEKLPENEKGRVLLKESGRNFIPEIGTTVILPDLKNPSLGQNIPGGWDNNINAYWDEMVVLYDYIFAVLNDLINQLNYFKQAVAY